VAGAGSFESASTLCPNNDIAISGAPDIENRPFTNVQYTLISSIGGAPDNNSEPHQWIVVIAVPAGSPDVHFGASAICLHRS
jgi:hypothetical protein